MAAQAITKHTNSTHAAPSTPGKNASKTALRVSAGSILVLLCRCTCSVHSGQDCKTACADWSKQNHQMQCTMHLMPKYNHVQVTNAMHLIKASGPSQKHCVSDKHHSSAHGNHHNRHPATTQPCRCLPIISRQQHRRLQWY